MRQRRQRTAPKRNRPLASLLRCAALLLAAAGVAVADSDLAWPLTLQRALSATFAETRSTAFHAGIDLKTWGKTGYEVHALADGYIMRLRTSPWGYGRVVYERLVDGRIVVYAHLESFAPAIADRVRAAQRETQRYSVNLSLAAGEIPVRKGEVIARSGQSGIGFPHLHLELRDADNVPINPITQGGLTVADQTPPTIRRIALTPVGLASGVEGSHQPQSVAVRWHPERGRFEAVETVTAHGTIGVSVLGYDRAEAANNKLAPFSNRLIVDGETALTAVYERVPYGDALPDRAGPSGAGRGRKARCLFQPLPPPRQPVGLLSH